jgi:PEP-CTERM motif
MSQPNILSKLASAVVVLGICFNPTTANALSLTFNAAGVTETITDRAGRGGDTRDTNGFINQIQFDRTFTTSTGTINVSGYLYGQSVTYTRTIDTNNVALGPDGNQGIILTLTDFKVTNNTTGQINLTNFLNIDALVGNFFSTSTISTNRADLYLSYIGGYQTTVGTSSARSSYEGVGVFNNTITVQGTPLEGTNFSAFRSRTALADPEFPLSISDLSLDLPSVSLASGASLILPNSLVSVLTIDDNGDPLTQENIEQLSDLVRQQLAAQTVPEPSSLLALLGLGGFLGLFSRPGKKIN